MIITKPGKVVSPVESDDGYVRIGTTTYRCGWHRRHHRGTSTEHHNPCNGCKVGALCMCWDDVGDHIEPVPAGTAVDTTKFERALNSDF